MSSLEYHPLEPFLPAKARILFLGSFPPPQKRWSMDFYYPNFNNDHWRIEGEAFFHDRNYFVDVDARRFCRERIVAFCEAQGLAFYDTARVVRRLRDNASDAFLEVVEASDVRALLAALPYCRAVVTTGEKATATLCAQLGVDKPPAVNAFVELPGIVNAENNAIELYRLPSSSRAYPMPIKKKAACYKEMFERYITIEKEKKG